MRIKRLDIHGFKSFVDKHSSFPDPITAVVGPNGCGKSNIVDAIRWVMGEQSAKHLRGRAMDDVIFAGSESRGPAGLAEVSLTFDARAMPGSPRRAESPGARSAPRRWSSPAGSIAMATSEYLLGGVPCRLRDVVEFFLGHRRGLEGLRHHRAGAHRLHRLVPRRGPPRPHRRGGRHHQVQGQEETAERRMESTPQHLLRISDIIAEIESRLRSLRIQAQKAERYKRYRRSSRSSSSGRLLRASSGSWPRRSRWARERGRERSARRRSEGARGRGGGSRDRAARGHRGAGRVGRGQGRAVRAPNKAELGSQRAQHYEMRRRPLPSRRPWAEGDRGPAGSPPGGAPRSRRSRAGCPSIDADADTSERLTRAGAAQESGARLSPTRGAARGGTGGVRRPARAGPLEWIRRASSRAGGPGRRASTPSAEEDAAARAARRLDGGAGAARRVAARPRRSAGRADPRAEPEDRRAGCAASCRAAARARYAARGGAPPASRLESLTEIQARYESFQSGVRAIMQEHRAAGGGAASRRVWSPTSFSRRPSSRPPSRRCSASAWATSSSSRTRRASRPSSSSSAQREGRSCFIPRALRAPPARGEVLYDAMGGASGTSVDAAEAAASSRSRRGRPPGRRARVCAADARAHRLRPAVRRRGVVPAGRRAGRRGSGAGADLVARHAHHQDHRHARRRGHRSAGRGHGRLARVGAGRRARAEARDPRARKVVERLDADLEAPLARHVSSASRRRRTSTRALEETAAACARDEMTLFGLKKDLDRAVQEGSACERRREQLAAQAPRSPRDHRERRASGRGGGGPGGRRADGGGGRGARGRPARPDARAEQRGRRRRSAN